MNKLILLIVLFSVRLSFAQTQLSGVINSYVRVNGLDYCEARIDVLSVANAQVGEEAILIQMEGAVIEQGNSENFGQVSDYNNAGNFELVEFESIVGNSIFLSSSFTNEYSVAGKIQLVILPQVEDNVEFTGITQADFWDGFSGGVLALKCNGSLTLNGPVSVNEQGFLGGISFTNNPNDCNFLLPQNNYFYETTSWRGASKGLGISPLILEKEAGKGPQANGGGGGNDHNSGGGGGANQSAGGKGGENREPSTFGCNGMHPGLGGRALDHSDHSRIFLGGGGGAGHSNNNSSGHGGGGAGIIIIIADEIIGNNHTISANGGDSFAITGDGGGGGGAGGTIVLKTNNITGPINIELMGGDGGTVENPADRCFGPGGGGSGGVIYTNYQLNLPGINTALTPGIAGLSLNSNVCPETSNGAENGTIGVLFSDITIPQGGSITPIIVSQPQGGVYCEDENVLLELEATGIDLSYQWQVFNGTWQNLNGANAASLNIANEEVPNFEGTLFRCVVSNVCGNETISETADYSLILNPTGAFTYMQDELNFDFFSIIENEESIVWDFGDGNTSTSGNPMHTYSSYGEYLVQLSISNICTDTVLESIVTIIEPLPPDAQFGISGNAGCAPYTVEYTDNSTNGVTERNWTFEGGIPATSTDANPAVVYNTPGMYSVTLVVSNEFGEDVLERSNLIIVHPLPAANFSFVENGMQVNFTNESNNASSYEWDFGDGNNSNSENPDHTYSTSGSFEVTLTVTNDCGTDEISQTIQFSENAPLAQFNTIQSTGCAPLTIQFNDQSVPSATEWSWNFQGGEPSTSSEQNPTIVYSNAGLYDVSMTVANEFGSSSIEESEFVFVVEQAFAGFEYFVNEQTVTFINQSENGNLYQWDFGDGSDFSTALNPIHTYDESGTYLVTLIVSNPFCAGAISINVPVNLTATEDLEVHAISVVPNPAQHQIHIKGLEQMKVIEECRIYSSAGHIVGSDIKLRDNTIQLAHLLPGLYFLKIETEEGVFVAKFIKN